LQISLWLGEDDRVDAAFAELIPYLIDVVESRRRSPGDDLLSALLAVEDQGDTLSMPELMSFVVLLYIAGHETTVNLIGNSVNALLNHPDQLAAWHADPSIGSRAVDECLRFDGPVQQTVRVPMVPVTYQGLDGPIVVDPGTIVTTVLGAADHDPTVFADPHSLRLDRPNANRHVAFAAGIHYCLGASLARLEAEIAVGSLVTRFPTMRSVGDITWRDRLTIRGVDRLALEF
ncbi:MAG: cytochrome P450, partial [Ilumatobacteraceae bacterium]